MTVSVMVMSIANLHQVSFTLSVPFFQCTDAGPINRQASQALTTDLTSFLGTNGSTDLANMREEQKLGEKTPKKTCRTQRCYTQSNAFL